MALSPRQAGKRAKNKGNNYERRVAKLIQDWWRQWSPTAEFARTPMSGGSALKLGWDMAGDIVCNDDEFPFHVEAKKQEHWTMEQLFKGTGPVLKEWWEQAAGECPEHRTPMLIFTRNNVPDFVMMEYLGGLFTPLYNRVQPLLFLHYEGADLLVFPFEGLNQIEPSVIVGLL
jgi:hypothetical protein